MTWIVQESGATILVGDDVEDSEKYIAEFTAKNGRKCGSRNPAHQTHSLMRRVSGSGSV
jgi:hypothetical protein